MMPHYLEATMDNFRVNQRKLQETWGTTPGTEAFAKLAETNMAMFQAAASAFIPGAKRPGGSPAPTATPPPGSSELDELKAQMAAMQKKLDELGK